MPGERITEACCTIQSPFQRIMCILILILRQLCRFLTLCLCCPVTVSFDYGFNAPYNSDNLSILHILYISKNTENNRGTCY